MDRVVVGARAAAKAAGVALGAVSRIEPPVLRGRPPDPRVAEWAARIENPEFLAYYEVWLEGSGFRRGLLSKSRCLLWLEHEEHGPSDNNGPSRQELTKMAKTRFAAIRRFYKNPR